MKKLRIFLMLALLAITAFSVIACNSSYDPYNPDYKPECYHYFSEWYVVTEPTCTQVGIEESVCTMCDVKEQRNSSPRHDMGEWETVKEPTCKEVGTSQKKCTRCDYAETDIILTTDDHTRVTINEVAPTCKDVGRTEGEKCDVCEKIFIVPEDISKRHSVQNGQCIYCQKNFSEGLQYSSLYSSDNTCTVTGIGSCTDSILYIPDIAPDGREVVAIKESAFAENVTIESVTIPDSVTKIGAHAFEKCYSLKEITIGKEVTDIGENAFADCFTVESVVIPDKVKTIGVSAFSGCTALLNLKIGASVNTICEKAFRHCVLLDNVDLANHIKTIGANAFDGCSALKSITIPSSITTIEASAFYYCSALESVTISNGVSTIGNSAFYGCSSIKTIEFPNSVKTIEASAFYNCDALERIVIGNGLTTIGEKAFFGCDTLSSITLGTGVKTLGNYAFASCTSLVEININSTAIDDLTEKSNIFDSASKNADGIAVNIGVTATKIPANLFRASVAPKVISLSFANNSLCEIIGSNAFYGCTSLCDVTIPHSIKTIGASAFDGCASLEEVTVPDTVATMGSSAFSNIAPNAFVSCESVTKPSAWTVGWISSRQPVIWDCNNNDVAVDANGNICALVDGLIYRLVDGNAYVAMQSISITEVSIPKTITYDSAEYKVTKIEEKAFYNCTKLTSVTIETNVTLIGTNAFTECTALTSAIFEGRSSHYWDLYKSGSYYTDICVYQRDYYSSYSYNRNYSDCLTDKYDDCEWRY